MDEPCWARHLPVYVRDTKQGQDRIRELDELLQISDDLLPEPTLSTSGIEDDDGSTLGVEADISDFGGFTLAREAVEQYRSKARYRLLKMAIQAAKNGLKTAREEQEQIKAGLEGLDWLTNRLHESSSGFQYPTCPRPEDCTGPCTREEVCIKAAQVRTLLQLKREVYGEVISHVRAGGSLDELKDKESAIEKPGIPHKRVLVLARVLQQYIDENGSLPSFESKGRMNDWLARQVTQSATGVVGLSGDAIRLNLESINCYVTGQHGRTEGIMKTLEKIISYGKRHS